MPIIEGSVRRNPVVRGTGDPTANVTGLGVARVGDLYHSSDTGRLFVCTATNGTSTITWALVGGQV